MALITTNPIDRDGVIYEKLAANLALSTMWLSGQLRLSIAVRLTPYRDGEEGPDVLTDEAKAVVLGEANKDAENDPDVAAFLAAIEAAGQAFINAKGL